MREGVKQRRYVKHLNVSPPEEVEQIKHKRWLTASKCHMVECGGLGESDARTEFGLCEPFKVRDVS